MPTGVGFHNEELRPLNESDVQGAESVVDGTTMKLTLRNTLKRFFINCNHSNGTKAEYRSTLKKWESWNSGVDLNELGRKEIAEFLDYVFVVASDNQGKNPGRTSNKAREQLRAVMSWAWEQELIDSLPRFPKPRKQRDVAGRHYLTISELNSLYFATYKLKRPRGWNAPFSIGKYWRCALDSVFQLRIGHRHDLANQVSSRTDSLETHFLGSELP